MSRGLGAQERKLLERARREGLTPVLPDDMDAFSSEASSIRRAARRLQDKGLIRLSLIDRNRRNGKSNNGGFFVNVLHMEPLPWPMEQRREWRYPEYLHS